MLITLTIIGVIAALTIPNLMKNYQTHIFKTAYKQAYSDINQAFAQAFKDGELIRTSGSQIEASTQEFEILKKNIKVSKECKRGELFSCWAQGDTLCGGTCSGAGYDEKGQEIVVPEGQPKAASYSFIDTSGRSWAQYSTNENVILVDTNGFKGPNKFGQDRFVFNPKGKDMAQTVNYANNPPVRFGPVFGNVTRRTWSCKFPPCYYYDWLYK